MAELVLTLVGDVNLRRHLDFDETCLDAVAGELARADVRLGNLEGCFSSSEAELAYKAGWFHPQPEMARCLVGNFDMVARANNVHHGEAILEGGAVLDAHGILHAGAGADLEEAHRPAVKQVGGARVGMLAYTSVFEPVGQAATPTAPGVATIRAHTAYEPSPRVLHMPGSPAIVHTWPEADDLARACEDVRRLRPEVDVVVVYAHFGVTSSPVVHEYQRTIAHALVDAGADVVAGSHSHTPGGIERYGSALIFYSLGNFAFNTGFVPQATRDGVLAKVLVRDGKITGCTLLPVYRTDAARTEIQDPAAGEGARIAAMLASRCAELGTAVQVTGPELTLVG